MYYKTIVKGKLDFGKEKTYVKVRRMADSKFEGLYRNEIAFDNGEVFNDEDFTLVIPRTVYNLTEKIWKNTLNLLEYLTQFAIVGRVSAWVIQDGQMVVSKVFEPSSDKAIVQRYIKGNKQMDEGDDQSALKTFEAVIDTYEDHALAYEKRGLINYKLANYEDALYDFNKSIKLFSQNGTAYFGKALACLKLDKLTDAIRAFDETIKKTIPHQKTYWRARRLKGDAAMELGQFEDALREYTLTTKKIFAPDDPNYLWLRYCYFRQGKLLAQLQRPGEAIKALENALEMEKSNDVISEEAILVLKGEILKELGDKNYVKDWKKAEKMGSAKAKKLLSAE